MKELLICPEYKEKRCISKPDCQHREPHEYQGSCVDTWCSMVENYITCIIYEGFIEEDEFRI